MAAAGARRITFFVVAFLRLGQAIPACAQNTKPVAAPATSNSVGSPVVPVSVNLVNPAAGFPGIGGVSLAPSIVPAMTPAVQATDVPVSPSQAVLLTPEPGFNAEISQAAPLDSAKTPINVDSSDRPKATIEVLKELAAPEPGQSVPRSAEYRQAARYDGKAESPIVADDAAAVPADAPDNALSALKGKRLMVIGSAVRKDSIFRMLKETGVHLILVDEPGSAFQKYADEFVPVHLSGGKAAQEILSYLESHPVDGQPWVFFDRHTPLGARLRFELGHITQTEYEALVMAKDKAKTRAWQLARGLPAPRFARLGPEADEAVVRDAIASVGTPAVFKLPNGTGGIGFRLVSSAREAAEYFKAFRVINRLVSLLPQRIASRHLPEAVGGMSLILEEYLRQPGEFKALGSDELDVDVLWQGKREKGIFIADNKKGHAGDSRDQLGQYPSRLPREAQEEIGAYVKELLADFPDGHYHIELMKTERAVQLIEINSRLAGGHAAALWKKITGIDLVVENVKLALGIPLVDYGLVRPARMAIARAWLSPIFGRITKMRGFGGMADQNDVYWDVVKKEGDPIMGPEGGYDFAAYVAVIGRDVADIDAGLNRIDENAELDVDGRDLKNFKPRQPRRFWWPLILGGILQSLALAAVAGLGQTFSFRPTRRASVQRASSLG